MAGESSQKRMGGQKQKWTSEEEEALKDGVKKHGIGKWKNILTDPEFAPSLTHRSNIDLKDKWRNLGISHIVQASKDISPYLAIPCGSHPTLQNTNTAQNAISTLAIVDADANANGINGTSIATPVRALQDSIQIPTKRYYSMIYEAISALKDSRGSEFNAIASFIEQRHDVPSNFRRSLSSLVRRLTVQGKLEKVEQRYKIKDTGSRIPAPRHRDGKPGTSKNTESLNPNTLEEAARIAAYRVADADNKSFLAAESIKEAERIVTMAEESELMLEVVKGIWERCNL